MSISTGFSRKRLALGAGCLVLAAGLGLAPQTIWAQTTDTTAGTATGTTAGTPATTAPATGTAADGLSLGVTEGTPPPPVAPVPPGFSFTTVKVTGNGHVDTATVLSYLALPKGKVLTEAALNDAYQRLFGSGLFAQAELVPQKNTLLVKVIENPTLGTVDIQGNARLSDDDLNKVTKLRSRQIYSPAQAEADARAMSELYRAKGRLAATITPRIIRRPNNQVDLVFEVTEGGVAEIARLSFVGNKAFSDYRLRQVLSSKQAGILHNIIQRDVFNADRVDLDKKLLSDFYLSRGYIDFEILDAGATYARNRDATFLTFTVREGQSFRIGKVTTISEVKGVDPGDFDRLRRLRTGVTYSPTVIQNNVDALESLALQKGLNFVMVDPRLTRNDRDGTVDVTFAIVKGQRAFVERIDIEGNTATLDSVVRRQFHTVEGDPMNAHEIAQAAERIRALGFFSDVAVTEAPGTTPDQQVVKVAVTEQPTGSLTLGATYGLASGFGVSVGFAEKNFLGRGQGLTVNVQTGSSNVDSQIAFSEPAFLGRDLEFGFAATYAKTTHQSAHYDTKTYAISPSLAFPVSDYGRLRLDYRVGREQLYNVDGPVFDTSIPPIETSNGSSAILHAEVGAQVSSAVGYSYSWDDRLSGLHPNGGISLQFGQDFAGLGGSVKTVTTSVRTLAETTVLHGDVTLRALFEGGVLSPYGGYTTRITDRYTNAGTMHGFEPNGIGPRDLGATNQDALGGNFFAAAHLESEFPLGLPEEYGIHGGAFLDVGSVWGLNNTAGTGGTVDDSLHLRSVIGIALFWKTPIGPLRFNFTHAIQKQSYDKEQTFDFTISTKF